MSAVSWQGTRSAQTQGGDGGAPAPQQAGYGSRPYLTITNQDRKNNKKTRHVQGRATRCWSCCLRAAASRKKPDGLSCPTPSFGFLRASTFLPHSFLWLPPGLHLLHDMVASYNRFDCVPLRLYAVASHGLNQKSKLVMSIGSGDILVLVTTAQASEKLSWPRVTP